MKPRPVRLARNVEAAESQPARRGFQTGLPPGIFLFIAVSAFYVWTATSSQYEFIWNSKKADHYNLLAEGFLKGHLYLAQDPPKELLALKNPLDPKLNEPYRMHDASLYNGHYYVYFGPVPVITLYLPWRIITGWSIPNNLAVIIYLLAGYVFSCLLLFALLDAAGVEPSWLQKRLAIAALGFCQTAPIILRRAYMYETAVAAGFCFLLAAFYFLARYVFAEKARPWHAVVAGLFLGFTPGCRPNYVVVVAVAVAFYFLYQWRTRGLRGRDLVRELYLFGGPIAFCGLALVWYNYARFGSPLNIGQVYQLVGSEADRGMSVHLSALLPGLFRFLVQPPLWARHFPFFEVSVAGDFGGDVWPRGVHYVEPVTGILAISPLCIIGLGLPWLLWRFRSKLAPALHFVLLTIYCAVLVNIVAIIMTVFRVAQRYEMDFAPSLMVLSLFGTLYLISRMDASRHRIGATVVLAVILGFSAFVQAALSINGYDNQLMGRNVQTFVRLASFFGDDSQTMRRLVYGVGLEGVIAFPQRAPGVREALVTSGVPGRSNSIFIEYLGGGRIRFGSYMSGAGTRHGPGLQITPGKPYHLNLNYDAGRGIVIIDMDGSSALNVPFFFYPTAVSDAAVLRNDFGVPPNIRPFSGELESPLGLQFAAAVQ
jgi:hypothetical protein